MNEETQYEPRDRQEDKQPSDAEVEKLSWSMETMRLINKLTPDIKGKALDPDWFMLRQRLEQMDVLLTQTASLRAELGRLKEELSDIAVNRAIFKIELQIVTEQRDSLITRNQELEAAVVQKDEALRELMMVADRMHAASLCTYTNCDYSKANRKGHEALSPTTGSFLLWELEQLRDEIKTYDYHCSKLSERCDSLKVYVAHTMRCEIDQESGEKCTCGLSALLSEEWKG